MDYGKKIKSLRIQNKLSMRELGERIGVSHAHISKLESGINSPSVELLEKISEYFSIDPSYFFIKDEEIENFDDNEKEMLFELDLSVEKLKDKYDLNIDGQPVTDDEVDEMIKYIRFLRHSKNNKSS